MIPSKPGMVTANSLGAVLQLEAPLASQGQRLGAEGHLAGSS